MHLFTKISSPIIVQFPTPDGMELFAVLDPYSSFNFHLFVIRGWNIVGEIVGEMVEFVVLFIFCAKLSRDEILKHTADTFPLFMYIFIA